MRQEMRRDKNNKVECKDYVKAWKRLTVKRSPNILTIALKRYQSYEFGSRLRIGKILALVGPRRVNIDCLQVTATDSQLEVRRKMQTSESPHEPARDRTHYEDERRQKRKNKKEKKNDTISKWMRMKNVAILHAWMFITRIFVCSESPLFNKCSTTTLPRK
ncbi:hypothetical protein Lal_00001301 [Lupinus albus]|nr:hypothetical protein Lal_00001301 [Lupinus albus]